MIPTGADIPPDYFDVNLSGLSSTIKEILQSLVRKILVSSLASPLAAERTQQVFKDGQKLREALINAQSFS